MAATNTYAGLPYNLFYTSSLLFACTHQPSVPALAPYEILGLTITFELQVAQTLQPVINANRSKHDAFNQ